MTFANKLVQLRKTAGLSQEDLAEKLNITRQAVHKWESGNSMPDIDNLKLLSDIFNISLDVLLNDNTDLPTTPAQTQVIKYGKVIKTRQTLRNVDIESDNTQLTDKEVNQINIRHIVLTILIIATIVLLIVTIATFANKAITAFIISLILFFVLFFITFLVWRFLYAHIYDNRTYFFSEKKRTESILNNKKYWFVQLQHDMLAWFFFDDATKSFGLYFLNNEQFICPIQNYSSITCTSFGQGIIQGNTKTSMGVMVGSVNGFSVSQTPTYKQQGNTLYNFTIYYFDENGKTCEYPYSLSCIRNYTCKSPANNENLIISLQNVCDNSTRTAFTKIQAKLEAEKKRFNTNN